MNTLREVLCDCFYNKSHRQGQWQNKKEKMYYIISAEDVLPLDNDGTHIKLKNNLTNVRNVLLKVNDEYYRMCRVLKGTKTEQSLLDLGFEMVPEEALDKYVGAGAKIEVFYRNKML